MKAVRACRSPSGAIASSVTNRRPTRAKKVVISSGGAGEAMRRAAQDGRRAAGGEIRPLAVAPEGEPALQDAEDLILGVVDAKGQSRARGDIGLEKL
jgi:hypothetical protein